MPDLAWEARFQADGHPVVAGIDEVGRGPWAGPIVAAAVVLPSGFALPGLTDSKQLSPAFRERLCEALETHPDVASRWVAVDAAEIDRTGLAAANREAMRAAAAGLPVRADFALIDGRPLPDFPIPHHGLVRGDSLSLSIAAASVIAKVHRDRIMVEFAHHFPAYGFEKHKGYGTRYHQQQLQRHGPCPIHRRSFRPVARFALSPHPDQPRG